VIEKKSVVEETANHGNTGVIANDISGVPTE